MKVIYIAGNGHSGSTLLDIILGSPEGVFSAGELSNITREGIMEEYCSCGEKIEDCSVWFKVLEMWNANREITYSEYRSLQFKFERNKASFITLWNYYFPSQEFKKYVDATFQLMKAIQKVTGSNIIIDSSKSAQRIAVLESIAELIVIHLSRDFKGVLNSAKKESFKDIRKGIEKYSPPRRTFKTLLDWILNNTLCYVFSFHSNKYKIKYNVFTKNPESLKIVQSKLLESNFNGSFSSGHMLAGNVIRLKKSITIDSKLGFKYERLNKKQLKLAEVIDRIFWFWS